MIPKHTEEALKRWVHYGNQLQIGHFTTALIENKLMESFQLADDHNLDRMFDIVKWIYGKMPVSSWSLDYSGMSDDDFENWLKHIEKG